MALKVAFAFAALLSLASACSVAPGGCTTKICRQLTLISQSDWNKSALVGQKKGRWTKVVPKTQELKRGGPIVNFEIFTAIGIDGSKGVIGTNKAKNLGTCCTACAQTAGCKLYQFFEKASVSKGKKAVPGFKKGTQCYLLNDGAEPIPGQSFGTPTSGTATVQDKNSRIYDGSWVGGICNPSGSVKDDPHFTGAMGTSFDFNGELNRPFCLITDRDFHLNVLLKGYEDSTAEKGMRSWIKELGLLWNANGKTHTARLAARNGKQQERGNGFLSAVEIDNSAVAVPASEGEATKADGFTLTFLGVEKLGPYDIDRYALNIAGVAKLTLRLRVAHKKLQSPDDAEAHFNIEVVELNQTPKVHGVLGQTFRTTEEQVKKALRFSELVELLHTPVRADGATGQGFLDGSVKDYETSSVLAPDCGFAAFSQ